MSAMAQNIRRPAFDPSKGLTVRRAFAVNGHQFAPGAAFPWKHLAVSKRLLMQLWTQRYLEAAGAAPLPAPVELPPIIRTTAFDEPRQPPRKK
jgi:hypothetical protein